MTLCDRLTVIAADDPDRFRSQRHPGDAGNGERARRRAADNDTAAEAHDAARCCPKRERIGGGLARRFRCLRIGSNGFDRRSEEHTSELQSLMRISYAVFCLKKKKLTERRK